MSRAKATNLRRALLSLALCALRTEGRARACARADEPPLASLTRAALREAALEPARVRSLLHRARTAGVLPEVSFHVGKGAYDSLRTTDTSDPEALSLDTLRFDVTVRFPLDHWIFNPQEVRVAEAAGRLTEHRQRLIEHVAALWAERRRIGSETAPGTPTAPTDRCVELTAVLDALTGGALIPASSDQRDAQVSLPVTPSRR